MGNNKIAERVWKEIAACNDGAYINVNMNVNDINVQTPYDSVIAVISDQLDDLRYYYGKVEVKSTGNGYKEKGKTTARVSNAGVKAQRAEYNSYYFSKKSGQKQNELLSDLASGNVRLDSLKQAELRMNLKTCLKIPWP